MDNDALLQRIEQRAKELGKTLRAVSIEATGSADTIRNWKRNQVQGKSNFSMRHASLQAVAEALAVDLHWLQTGEQELLGLQGHGMAEETAEFRPKASQSDAIKALYAETAKRAEVVRRMVIALPALDLGAGDLVICDLGREPTFGDTVLVHVQDGKPNGSTLIRRWISPWLLAYDSAIDADPLRDDETGVTIRYPVIGCVRGA
jgi:hypothetical protein